MFGFLSDYFDPLNKSACVYFLIISVLFFIGLVIVLVNEIYFVVTNFSKLNFRMLSTGFIITFNIWLSYFVNRLLYSMCTKSLA